MLQALDSIIWVEGQTTNYNNFVAKLKDCEKHIDENQNLKKLSHNFPVRVKNLPQAPVRIILSSTQCPCNSRGSPLQRRSLVAVLKKCVQVKEWTKYCRMQPQVAWGSELFSKCFKAPNTSKTCITLGSTELATKLREKPESHLNGKNGFEQRN